MIRLLGKRAGPLEPPPEPPTETESACRAGPTAAVPDGEPFPDPESAIVAQESTGRRTPRVSRARPPDLPVNDVFDWHAQPKELRHRHLVDRPVESGTQGVILALPVRPRPQGCGPPLKVLTFE